MPFCVAKSAELPLPELLEGIQTGVDVFLAGVTQPSGQAEDSQRHSCRSGIYDGHS